MKNRNIVVSGASKGIGRSIVERFFEAGFDVAFCARDSKVLNQFKNELDARGKDQKVLAISCDLSVKNEVQSFAEQVLFEFEEIDVLVNNAGIYIPGRIIEEPEGVFEQLMQTNLFSAYYLIRSLTPYMSGSKKPHLFNICSTASIEAYPNGGSYCISKFALLGMSKVLRLELMEQGIPVTSVLPGATLTDSWKGTELPVTRFMDPASIAESVYQTYLLGPGTVIEELLLRPFLGDIR